MKQLGFFPLAIVLGAFALPLFSIADEGAKGSVIDFNKINGIFKDVIEETIKGDDLVNEMQAGFDEAYTSVEKRRIGIFGKIVVARSAWSPSPTSLSVKAQAEVEGEGETAVAKAQISLGLGTDTAKLLAFAAGKIVENKEYCSEEHIAGLATPEEQAYEKAACQELALASKSDSVEKFIGHTLKIAKLRHDFLQGKPQKETEIALLEWYIASVKTGTHYDAQGKFADLTLLFSEEIDLSIVQLKSVALRLTASSADTVVKLDSKDGAAAFQQADIETLLLKVQNEDEQTIGSIKETLAGFVETAKQIIKP